MFFDDVELIQRKGAQLRSPPIPDTGWKVPTEFPNLANATVIAVDIETKDTDLLTAGPGWARGPKGHIVGVSLAARDRQGNRGKWYFPCRHEVEPQTNIEPQKLFGWLRSILETNVPKVGANLIYDYGWLTEENIFMGGPLWDCQFSEALIDEQAFVALDALAHKYVQQGKSTALLYQWLADAYGGKANAKQRANIYRAPARLVGPYAEDDADLPIQILEQQWPLLSLYNLTNLFELECKAIRLIVKMRQAGVTVDLNAAEQLNDRLKITEIPNLYAKFAANFGVTMTSMNSPKQLAAVFDHNNVKYPRTKEGNPSFRKEWLTGLEHPLGDAINEIRGAEKVQGTFIESYILEKNVNGKIHCSYHPLLGESGGTITGRWSSSDPNLQNIPVRTEIGKLVRKIFKPDKGHRFWRKRDYSQIEYRMLAHYAVGKGSDELRQQYIRDPKTDYHQGTMNRFAAVKGIDLKAMTKEALANFRRPIKNVNFGLIYGQGETSLAYKANMTAQESKEFFKVYYEAAPYVKPTMESVIDEINETGIVKTILGRTTHFNSWEPMHWPRGTAKEDKFSLPYQGALYEWGTEIKRAYAYKGVNYKLQGSAADVLKTALVAADESGVFDEIGVPRLQVHDELDWSVYNENPEAWRYLDHVLENSLLCRVPIRIDGKDGERWGDID